MNPWLTLLISLLSSSAIFGFIQFLITRKDNKAAKLINLEDTLHKLDEKLTQLGNEIVDNRNDLTAMMDKSEAIHARIRILAASDELRAHVKHSHEWFVQLLEDTTVYERYCCCHPEFENNRAVSAIEFIHQVYQNCLRENSFL